MNWNRMEGKWKQRRGKAVHHWGKVMNDDLAAIAGKYEVLVGGLQEKYGIAQEVAQRQVDEFKHMIDQLKESNNQLAKAQVALHRSRVMKGKRLVSKPPPKWRRNPGARKASLANRSGHA